MYFTDVKLRKYRDTNALVHIYLILDNYMDNKAILLKIEDIIQINKHLNQISMEKINFNEIFLLV